MATTSHTLLERVRDPTDEEAWERFFSIYAPLLEQYARSCGLSRDDAEEVRDQCLAVVVRRMPGFRYDPGRGGGFQGWLHRIAHGKVVDHLRRPSRAHVDPAAIDELPAGEPGPDALWERAWRAEHLRWSLERVRRRLPERWWRVFALLLLEGLEVDEVCARTGLSREQVYKAKSRALARVREVLARLGTGADGLV